MIGRWVVINLYGQAPVAGMLTLCRVGVCHFFGLVIPTQHNGSTDMRLFGFGTINSMTVLAGGRQQAIDINRGPSGRRTAFHKFACHIAIPPTAKTGLN